MLWSRSGELIMRSLPNNACCHIKRPISISVFWSSGESSTRGQGIQKIMYNTLQCLMWKGRSTRFYPWYRGHFSKEEHKNIGGPPCRLSEYTGRLSQQMFLWQPQVDKYGFSYHIYAWFMGHYSHRAICDHASVRNATTFAPADYRVCVLRDICF